MRPMRYILYVAMFMVPYINPANQAPVIQTGHAPGGRELP